MFLVTFNISNLQFHITITWQLWKILHKVQEYHQIAGAQNALLYEVRLNVVPCIRRHKVSVQAKTTCTWVTSFA